MPTSARVAVDASFGDSTTIMPNYTCSTDSCTFSQPYHSIGLCSKCTDVLISSIPLASPGTEDGPGTEEGAITPCQRHFH
jgi:hypothetical protein